MGDKITAKRTAKAAGVPVVPGTDGPVQTDEEAKRLAHEIGFPVLIKAAGGGGGKGMQLAQGPEELDRALTLAKREALANFGNDAVYLERYLYRPRHIEVQILADNHGNVEIGRASCREGVCQYV